MGFTDFELPDTYPKDDELAFAKIRWRQNQRRLEVATQLYAALLINADEAITTIADPTTPTERNHLRALAIAEADKLIADIHSEH